jgi:thymidylate synthase ThyX
MFDGIGAELVWDGTDEIRIPERMGEPRDDQMGGTSAEQLTELCGRCCYHSLGSKRSRPSSEYIKHILEVGHFSIAEHYNATILLTSTSSSFIDMLSFVMLNRPWVWVTPLSESSARITTNIRAAMEFDGWTVTLAQMMPEYPVSEASHLAAIIKSCWHGIAPRFIKDPHPISVSVALDMLDIVSAEVVEPETDAEKWISLYIYGSRGLTHELVRHGDFTSISQRSTRFVNESKSPWTLHPLIQMYIREASKVEQMIVHEEIKQFIDSAKDLYKIWVKRLIPFVKLKIDPEEPYAKTTARKQARGAARGLLGNALETELIFSANVMQWKHMVKMRAADAADGEIRFCFQKIIEALRTSRYADSFVGIQLAPSVDGIGMSLTGGGAA